MKLRRVRIQNYRSIKLADFCPTTLCALIGGNNCGKSNVLRAINLVLGDRWPSVRGIEDKDFHGYDENSDISITIWFDETRQVRGDVGDPVDFTGIQFTVTRYKVNRGRHRKGDLRSTFVCVDDNGDPVKILRRSPGGAGKPHQEAASVSEETRSALPAVMVDVDRNAKHHLSGSQWSILGRMLYAVSKGLKSDTDRYTAFREKFEEARQLLRTSEFDQLQQEIVNNLEAHTGITGVEITLDEVDPINLYKSFSVLFKDPETPNPVDAERMGSGIQSAVVISLLQAYRVLHKEDAILLFEEPELFLHPHGRRHLYRLLSGLADEGTQVIYTTHCQDFVDLERMDSVQLVTKSVTEGTALRPPARVAISDEWRKRLKLIRHFSSPRNEVFFADSVVLVEGQTELGTIAQLASMMPTPLDLDRLNCSIIEAGGKPNLPLFIGMILALGRRLLVVYDTDSDKDKPEDIQTNAKRKQEIKDALDGRGTVFECDPYLEELAGVKAATKKDKEIRMREHLSDIQTWEAVPDGLKNLMEAVAKVARGVEQ